MPLEEPRKRGVISARPPADSPGTGELRPAPAPRRGRPISGSSAGRVLRSRGCPLRCGTSARTSGNLQTVLSTRNDSLRTLLSALPSEGARESILTLFSRRGAPLLRRPASVWGCLNIQPQGYDAYSSETLFYFGHSAFLRRNGCAVSVEVRPTRTPMTVLE